MSDLRTTAFGISSPRSSTGSGYSCAYPSWPNRPNLDRRTRLPEPPTSAAKHSIPSVEFLESLRHRPRPESVFDDDDDDDGDFAVGSSSSAASSGSRGHPLPLPPARPVQRSNSLLSQAFSQLHNRAASRAV